MHQGPVDGARRELPCYALLQDAIIAEDRVGIDNPDWLSLVDENFPQLQQRHSEYLHHIELGIGDRLIIVPIREKGKAADPSHWFRLKHQSGRVHEPGLIAWIDALAYVHRDRRVNFYDIGALFGYFALIAAKSFDDVRILAVEANKESAEFASQMMRTNQVSNAEVRNLLVGEGSGKQLYQANGFQFRPFADREEALEIETNDLATLLYPEEPATVDIIKIDVEGYQAIFLPPATEELIRRRAILLLELDHPSKIARLGATNADLLQPFLDQGYGLYWSDHRDPWARPEKLDRLARLHDRNSLAVLMPPAADRS